MESARIRRREKTGVAPLRFILKAHMRFFILTEIHEVFLQASRIALAAICRDRVAIPK